MADARLARAGAHAMGPWGWSILGWLALMRGSSRAALWPSRHRFRYRIVICSGGLPGRVGVE